MITLPVGEIVCGDCLDVMRQWPDGCIDAVITDPPYFRVKGEQWDRQWDTSAGFIAWLDTVLIECQRLLRSNGSLYVFASPQMAWRVEGAVAGRFNVLNHIVWRKEAGWHKKAAAADLRGFFPQTERIIFAEQRFAPGAPSVAELVPVELNPMARRVAEYREAARLQRGDVDSKCSPSMKPTGLCYRWEAGDCLPTLEQFVCIARLAEPSAEYEALRAEYEALRRPFLLTDQHPKTDVWDYAPVAPYPGKHPCEKPVLMLRHMISACTKPGQLILDPFFGSGTTGVAANLEGRTWIGIERDPDYCAIAKARTAQQGLFTEAAR